MGFLEALLIIIGVLFIVGSFFVADKLSDKDVKQIAALSEAQLKTIVDKEIEAAKERIQSAVDEVVDETEDKAELMMEKESNSKIMAISEYSDTVLESINKTHNEVMFLYDMLNNKYSELTDYANELSGLQGRLDSFQTEVNETLKEKEVEKAAEISAEEIEYPVETVKEETVEQPESEEEEVVVDKDNLLSHKSEILDCYEQGMTEVEIAKKYGLGIGAVRLVVELYKGER
ncbi:MAG: hypothetical protein K6A30_04915 [Lachnospiraceae bacterium]|nr:hypothetical protein [Lachnospiraceae bacterium]